MTPSEGHGASLLQRLRSLAAADQEMTVRRMEANQVLVTEGDNADAVYVLIDGSLEITKRIDGRDAVLAELTAPGTIVGEMVSLGGGVRTATVTTTAPSELYSLPAGKFQNLLSTDRDFAAYLSAVAVRHAEQGELAEIIVEKLGVTDPSGVATACSAVEWRSLGTSHGLPSRPTCTPLRIQPRRSSWPWSRPPRFGINSSMGSHASRPGWDPSSHCRRNVSIRSWRPPKSSTRPKERSAT